MNNLRGLLNVIQARYVRVTILALYLHVRTITNPKTYMNIGTLTTKTLLIATSLLSLTLTSCNDDTENPVTPPNFEIVSSESFKVLETYENGWIKEAVQYRYDTHPWYEFSYYQNGHIKSYRLYRQGIDVYSVYLEHTRSENDLPLTSKYYDVDGDVFAELSYNDGLIASKRINYGGAQTTFLYEGGVIQRVEKTDEQTGAQTLITYNHTANKRTVKITVPEKPDYILETSLSNLPGTGFSITDDIQLLNLMGDDFDYSALTVNQSFASSLIKMTSVDIGQLCISPVNYFYIDDEFKATVGYNEASLFKNLMNSDLNRSIREQYPFTEGTVFVGQSMSVKEQFSLGHLSEVIENTNELKNQYAGDFELLYGNGYVSKFFTGKNLLVIGTIRNLPSDLTLRSQIVDTANKFANDLINNTNTLTAEEQELLSRVFFQLKAHSNILDINGKTITSYNDYQQVVNLVTAAEAPVVNVVLSRHF